MVARLDHAVVVTGASTGIGRAAVAEAARNGAHVFPSVRRAADATSLKAEFRDAVTPLVFDVVDEDAILAGADEVAHALGDRRLFGLVNNAGLAVPGPLLHLTAEDLQRQLDVNLIGVHRVTRAFAPLLGADPQRSGPPGRIVMISSVGGQNGLPFVGAYNASKFALEGYSQALRRELMLYEIDVIVVAPGAIATPIWDKADEQELAKFADTPYAPMLPGVRDYMVSNGKQGLDPRDVGALIWRCLTLAHPKVRYTIAKRPFMDVILPRLAPPRMVDRVVAQRLGFPSRA